jgi:protein-disulfide isomerase
MAMVGGAIVLVVALLVAGCGTSHQPSKAAGLNGIPQKGIDLGNPNAKVTVIEVTDPQCPYCGEYARNTFPSLVDKYVRTGKVRFEYAGVAFIGRDSESLLRLAYAAGFQNKLWNVVGLEFARQGTENSGYATDAFLESIAKSVPGLNAKKVLAAAKTNVVVPPIDASVTLAEKYFGKQFNTPSFAIERKGSKQIHEVVGAQPLSVFVKAIDAELKK